MRRPTGPSATARSTQGLVATPTPRSVASDQSTGAFLRVWHAPNVGGGAPDGFRNPTPVTELDGDGTVDVPTWLSDDGCVLLLSSDRSGGSGGRDIYLARRK